MDHAIIFLNKALYIPLHLRQSGFSGIKSAVLRKKLAKISDGDSVRWKANARGVDLNHNYPYKFKKSSVEITSMLFGAFWLPIMTSYIFLPSALFPITL